MKIAATRSNHNLLPRGAGHPFRQLNTFQIVTQTLCETASIRVSDRSCVQYGSSQLFVFDVQQQHVADADGPGRSHTSRGAPQPNPLSSGEDIHLRMASNPQSTQPLYSKAQLQQPPVQRHNRWQCPAVQCGGEDSTPHHAHAMQG